MKLSETTFDEMKSWMSDPTKFYYRRMQELPYVTWDVLKIIYDYMSAHGLDCSGSRLRVSWKGGEFISALAEPLGHKATREDFIWDLFHEVWCKAEWAARCGRSPQELGYESVKAEFGIKTIKAINDVLKSQRTA